MRLWLGLFLLCALPACSYRLLVGSLEDAGTDEIDASAYGSQDAGLPTRYCPPAQVDAVEPLGVVAIWEGYMEQPPYAASDKLRVVVQRLDAEGGLMGRLTFGTAAAPSPVSSSGECYPASAYWAAAVYPFDSPVEGVEYPITDVTASDVRLKFSANKFHPWTHWCACQVSFGGTCLPNTGSSAGNGRCYLLTGTGYDREVPCCQLFMCLHPIGCICSGTGCTVQTDQGWTFDLAVEGTRADGPADWPWGGVHLTRVQ